MKILPLGAIKILDSLGCDTTLSFGSECGNLAILDEIAHVLLVEPKEYKTILEHELGKGLSFPKARENALLIYLNDIKKYANVLSGSNNILAIEYLKAIKLLKSNISCLTIPRIATQYNNKDIVGKYCSATGIRELISQKKEVKKLLPESSYKLLAKEVKYGNYITNIAKFEKEICYKLRTMSLEEIANIPDVSEGLENKIKSAVNSCNNIEDLVSVLQTKRYTNTRIYRILLYALLNITKHDMMDSYKVKPYIRVLGMNQNGKRLLSKIVKKNKKLPVITSVKKFNEKNTNKILKNMLEKDMLATDIYTLGFEYNSKAKLDYTQRMVIL